MSDWQKTQRQITVALKNHRVAVDHKRDSIADAALTLARGLIGDALRQDDRPHPPRVAEPKR